MDLHYAVCRFYYFQITRSYKAYFLHTNQSYIFREQFLLLAPATTYLMDLDPLPMRGSSVMTMVMIFLSPTLPLRFYSPSLSQSPPLFFDCPFFVCRVWEWQKLKPQFMRCFVRGWFGSICFMLWLEFILNTFLVVADACGRVNHKWEACPRKGSTQAPAHPHIKLSK